MLHGYDNSWNKENRENAREHRLLCIDYRMKSPGTSLDSQSRESAYHPLQLSKSVRSYSASTDSPHTAWARILGRLRRMNSERSHEDLSDRRGSPHSLPGRNIWSSIDREVGPTDPQIYNGRTPTEDEPYLWPHVIIPSITNRSNRYLMRYRETSQNYQ